MQHQTLTALAPGTGFQTNRISKEKSTLHLPFRARLESARAAANCASTDGEARIAMSGGTAPAAAIAIWFASAQTVQPWQHACLLAHIPFPARLHSAHAASFCTTTDGEASSATSGGTAPAAAIAILFAPAQSTLEPRHVRSLAHLPFPARFSSAPAACSCAPTDGDASSATSGGTAPAATIAISFASAERRKIESNQIKCIIVHESSKRKVGILTMSRTIRGKRP